MFRFPNALTAQGFLERHWQKSALFLPQAIATDLPRLSADELAWLATLDDVESRLVFTEQTGDTVAYRVEHGPFEAASLGALPDKNWTLLVHDVDKHLPDFRCYFREAPFVPDWRIDDLMVSFAVSGGGVGPHRDNYDVFLCQGNGHREWRLAPLTATLTEVASGDLALVEPFTGRDVVTTRENDVLYLPPGIAHWGIAEGDCMTYSIGMQAPCLRNNSLYRDPDLTSDEAEPGLISDEALHRAEPTSAMDFGRSVTATKEWLTPEPPQRREIDDFLNSDAAELRVHGMARLAYCPRAKLAFANGAGASASAEQLRAIRQLCVHRMADEDLVRTVRKSTEINKLFVWLAEQGLFDFQGDQT